MKSSDFSALLGDSGFSRNLILQPLPVAVVNLLCTRFYVKICSQVCGDEVENLRLFCFSSESPENVPYSLNSVYNLYFILAINFIIFIIFIHWRLAAFYHIFSFCIISCVLLSMFLTLSFNSIHGVYGIWFLRILSNLFIYSCI